jgi:hypothetical protein
MDHGCFTVTGMVASRSRGSAMHARRVVERSPPSRRHRRVPDVPGALGSMTGFVLVQHSDLDREAPPANVGLKLVSQNRMCRGTGDQRVTVMECRICAMIASGRFVGLCAWRARRWLRSAGPSEAQLANSLVPVRPGAVLRPAIVPISLLGRPDPLRRACRRAGSWRGAALLADIMSARFTCLWNEGRHERPSRLNITA